MQNKKSGFTLIEIGIVVLVLAFLTIGIFAGQSLLRQNKVMSLITQQQSFVNAIDAFELKYNYLPGDMPDAYDIWGDACGTDTTDPSTGCNGDGNNKIENYFVKGEGVKAWEHLSKALFLKGNFNGEGDVSSEGGGVALSETNIPKSGFEGTYWTIGDYNCESCATENGWVVESKYILTLGAIYDAGNDVGWMLPSPDLSNAEVYSIDLKIDDGKSNAGNMMSFSANGMCGDGNSGDVTDYYDLKFLGADTKGQCNPNFIIK